MWAQHEPAEAPPLGHLGGGEHISSPPGEGALNFYVKRYYHNIIFCKYLS